MDPYRREGDYNELDHMEDFVTLLGVPLDRVTNVEALARIRSFLEGATQRHVVTPNAEMLVAASRNPEFCAVLKNADLHLPDSAGVVAMARLLGQEIEERVTGVDTAERLLLSLDSTHPVFLLGAREGVAARAAERLLAKNPRLKIVGAFAGSPSDAEAVAILEKIRAAAPHLLLVAYGAPVQDLWITKYLKSLPSVRVAMGVGGTFDVLAGDIRRAPKILQRFKLEWAWRLLLEPRRIKRIVTAVFVFPMLALRDPAEETTKK